MKCLNVAIASLALTSTLAIPALGLEYQGKILRISTIDPPDEVVPGFGGDYPSSYFFAGKRGTYSQGNEFSGILYDQVLGPMGEKFRFEDTAGKERCYGRVEIFIDDSGRRPQGNVTSTWYIAGAMKGYRCSNVGKKIVVEGMRLLPRSSKTLTER